MPASVALVTAAFAFTRRPAAAIPALLAGAVLDAGMYAQRNLAVMYASIAAGYLAWAALALWAARARQDATARRRPARAPAADGRTTREPSTKE